MDRSKNKLYGDGIHDDLPAIQEMIDSGKGELRLPFPEECYLITAPIVIPSNFKLVLPRFAEIKLKGGSNCFMLQNKTVAKPEKRLRDYIPSDTKELWKFYDLLSPDENDTCHDFEIEGGIWNFNNMNQKPNPIYLREYDENNYLGHCMFFYNVKNFRLSNMTIKDPANYAVMIDTGSYFTVENIVFDFNDGNPIASNMDGIHLNGSCHFGTIRNLRGACYDDLVALNAYEGSAGDITDIEIDGLFAEGCHSAVRLLTVEQNVRNIRISNVYGTYYQYCIGLTKFYAGKTTGCFDSITLDGIYASKAKRLPIQEAHMTDKSYSFPFVWIQEDTVVKSLTVNEIHRREYVNTADTIHIGKGALVEKMTLGTVTVENHVGGHLATFVNNGRIGKLVAGGLSRSDMEGDGEIETVCI